MNADRDLERQLRRWLDEEGPQDVPDRVVDIAIEEAATTRRRRPLPGFAVAILDGIEAIAVARQLPVARVWLAIVVLVSLLALSVVLAGAFLFQVDRLRTNGVIAYDADGDLFVVGSRPGSEPIQLTSTPDVAETDPLWSPDGRYLAYWVTSVDHAEVHVIDQETGRRITLRDDDELLLPLDARVFGWSPDSRQIAVPARGTSADGQRVGVEIVVLFDVETATSNRIPVDGVSWSFGWSPDGRYLGLVGPDDLFVLDLQTDAAFPVRGERSAGTTEAPWWRRDIPPTFSADSRYVIFTDTSDDRGSGGDILAFRIGDPSDRLIAVTDANELGVAASRDGRRIAYGRSGAVTIDGALGGLEAQGGLESELLVVPAEGGSPSSVATRVWPGALWSPDSQRLLTKSLDDELVIIDVDRPDEVVRIPMDRPIGGFSWAPGGRDPPDVIPPR